ncbi:hypothetical protein, partial [Klebsiella pneumoniae]|uniref:hypothetical protein n=1 Tax=Klebsiella pneumoniae TaxID=573 RepID=UPI00272F1BD7
ADVVAARADGNSRVLALQPAYIKAGNEAEVSIIGTGLKGMPVLGQGIDVIEVISDSDSLIKVRARATEAASGIHEVSVGAAQGGR